MGKNDRLRQLLGPAGVLLHPVKSLLLLLLACIPILPFASNPLGVPLAAISTYLLLMAVRLEESWLAITPLPPLTIVCLGAWLRCGLGGLLLAVGAPQAGNAIWAQLPHSQALWLITSALIVALFSLIRPNPPTTQAITSQDATQQPLINLTLFCGLFAVISIGIGVFAGTLDRNPESYMHWLNQRWQPDTFFTAFSRFGNIFFFLSPMAFFKAKRVVQRTIISGMFSLYIILAIPLGGRGLILYPIIYAALGLLLTKIPIKTIRILFGFILVVAITVIPTVSMYRGDPAFKTAARGDYLERVSILGKVAQKQMTDLQLSSLLGSTGSSLYACSDGYLFQEPAASRPRAGFHRMEAFLTAWIPSLLIPKKIPVRDAHIIAEEARGRSRLEAETMNYRSFNCVSLGGDLYWRGGWFGVVIGSSFAAIAYRLICWIWYRKASWDSVWQILLLIFPATFLTVYPAGSVGETAWLWMWDLPKYVVLIFITQQITRRFKQGATP
nr:hypothetical protein [Synechococcus sp. AH-551-E11]